MTDKELTRLSLGYALAKQLSTAYEINSNYGALQLDDEMRDVIESTLRPILVARLAALESSAK